MPSPARTARRGAPAGASGAGAAGAGAAAATGTGAAGVAPIIAVAADCSWAGFTGRPDMGFSLRTGLSGGVAWYTSRSVPRFESGTRHRESLDGTLVRRPPHSVDLIHTLGCMRAHAERVVKHAVNPSDGAVRRAVSTSGRGRPVVEPVRLRERGADTGQFRPVHQQQQPAQDRGGAGHVPVRLDDRGRVP